MKMIVLVFALFVSACSSTYLAVRPGQFSGKLDVRWIENDRFLFLSRTEEPFVFKRPDGQIIRPGPMYTDGGSIPRLLWGIKGYSPWGYAPAYIVHDWLFEAKHCQYSAVQGYDFAASANVLAEALKALMEEKPEFRNTFVFESVTLAVRSPIAEKLWDEGACKPPAALPFGPPPGQLLGTITF